MPKGWIFLPENPRPIALLLTANVTRVVENYSSHGLFTSEY